MGVRLWTIKWAIQYLSGITICTFSYFHYISDNNLVHVILSRALPAFCRPATSVTQATCSNLVSLHTLLVSNS